MAKSRSKLSLLEKATDEPRPEPTETVPKTLTPEGQAITQDLKTREPQEHSVITQLSVLALLDSGMSERVVAEHAGIPHSTVNAIKHNERLRYLLDGRAERIKKSLPALLYEVATQGISSITFEEIKKLNPLQRITMGAIAIDKARLLEGLSTENISVRELVPRIQDEIAEARKQQQQLIELVQSKKGVYEAAT